MTSVLFMCTFLAPVTLPALPRPAENRAAIDLRSDFGASALKKHSPARGRDTCIGVRFISRFK